MAGSGQRHVRRVAVIPALANMAAMPGFIFINLFDEAGEQRRLVAEAQFDILPNHV